MKGAGMKRACRRMRSIRFYTEPDKLLRMKKNGTLVVYHSKTGNNKSAAQAIAKSLKAGVMEVGIGGTCKGLPACSMIIFCFPIWAFSPCAPIKKFISGASLSGKKAGAVTVCGGHPLWSERSFRKLVEKSGGTFMGFASISDSKDRAKDNALAVQKAKAMLSA
jgi:hypothetical protein